MTPVNLLSPIPPPPPPPPPLPHHHLTITSPPPSPPLACVLVNNRWEEEKRKARLRPSLVPLCLFMRFNYVKYGSETGKDPGFSGGERYSFLYWVFTEVSYL
ncbi:hypothetical protein M0804_014293 [Polistes exclamans]|nr:hypothetical protein M0804_014297 [Polistes exclamans]KAI4475460.1 hypothetical protein M0804_014293 [Polistes exclamans]